MRIKSKWHNKKREKSVEEIAGAAGYIAWRIGVKTTDKMYTDGFNFATGGQLLDVIGEFGAFQLQLAARLVYERMENQEERQRFIQAMAGKLVEAMQENRVEQEGPGDYGAAYVEKLNERLEGYSEFQFVDEQPSYQMLRYFGDRVDEVMGGTQNKWVMEQVAEVEAPEAVKALKKGIDDLFG